MTARQWSDESLARCKLPKASGSEQRVPGSGLYSALVGIEIEKGVWRRMFEAMSGDPDFEYLIVDITIVRAQHASGAQKMGLSIKPLDIRAAASALRYIWPSEAWDTRPLHPTAAAT